MKKLILGMGCVICFAMNAHSQQSRTPVEAEKREALNLQLWKQQHQHIKIVSFENFSSRQKKSRDYMLMHGVLIYEGNELRWSDIELFQKGQRPAAIQTFINEENLLQSWLDANPDAKIISQSDYNSMDDLSKADFNSLTVKVIYSGTRLRWQDVMNYPN